MDYRGGGLQQVSVGKTVVYNREMWLDVDMTASQTISLESAIAYSNLSLENVICDTVPRARIDWGDGTAPFWTDCKDVATLKHTYSAGKQYQIKIGGTIAWNCAYSESPDSLSNFLIGITVPMHCPIRTYISYDGYMTPNQGRHGAFERCSKLKSIKGDLFNSLINSATNKSDYDLFFYYCSSLASIPENFFQSIVASSDATRTNLRTFFGRCSSLTSIPEKLFAYFSEQVHPVLNINSMFTDCTGLKSIPDGLYKNLPSHIKTIDWVLNFIRCTGLTSLSPELFNIREDLKVAELGDMFWGCTGLTGEAPPLWEQERFESIRHVGCFYNCTKLTNYAEIPEEWKKNNYAEASVLSPEENLYRAF